MMKQQQPNTVKGRQWLSIHEGRGDTGGINQGQDWQRDTSEIHEATKEGGKSGTWSKSAENTEFQNKRLNTKTDHDNFTDNISPQAQSPPLH